MNKKKAEKKSIQTTCDMCAYNVYDEEYESYVCDVNMDEDDMSRMMSDRYYNCPYFKNGDEYAVVRHQM